jgi:hypothetical protein
LLLSVLKE